ncbi:MAG TPA: formate dehydrogenase subunit alpha [Steroidobacteraceae bacterium]|jgi:formate dehydrogenase major subunit|nr:formate dehydrogenase subunit alpha [Steroidobacteraceae bacterium]
MFSLDHYDLGTPPSQATESVTLEIDGRAVTVPAGTSVMRAAAIARTQIPKLCATDTLKAFGSCRLCLVEIEGRKGYPASCTTEVAQGMKVKTQSETLERLRRGVMELYLSDHPAELVSDQAPVRTEIRAMAQRVGCTQNRYGADGARHVGAAVDDSNPYFQFDPNACIVCSRCVRACDEVQGTFALTIEGRGFASRVVASQNESFVASECVSCGACIEACPTTALQEKTLVARSVPDRAVTTTCAYCGVGCSFKAEMKGETVVRMAPDRDGKANHGHACVKGRFAYGYATHEDRVRTPLVRAKITDPWREVSWDEALQYAASEFKRLQANYGRDSVGGITSSRCTNEEAYLVQKLVRAAFGNNNVDTCARVCHSPTGYGLKHTLGESAGTQAFTSLAKTDVVLLIGANPTEGHPVFASQLKQRLRQGAHLIVADPRSIAIVRAPHVQADYHLQLRPGTNVALMNAMSHVVVTEGLTRESYIAERCEQPSYQKWKAFVAHPDRSPEATADATGVPAEQVRAAARLYAKAGNAAIYYGLGVTEHSQGTTMVMCIANLAMATGNLGREGVGVNPLRGQNNVQGSCDMGSFPHELSGYRHISDRATRALFESVWGVALEPEPGLRIPNMFEAALDGTFKGLYVQGEDMAQSDPNTQHVTAALSAMECIVVQDLFLNETAKYAHVFLPGSSFLEKDGTFTNAERRISRVRKVMQPLAGLEDWQVTVRLSNALGYPMHYSHPSEIMDEIAALTPTFHGVSYDKIDRLGSIQWPCNERAPDGTPTMHIGEFVRGKGKFFVTEYVPTTERTTSRYPLLLTTGRVLSQYNVGAQTRRTKNVVWHDEDRLEIHPHDAETRGVGTGDWVGVASRAGDTVMRALVTDRVQPGVVYTTFHFPESGANVVTTENSDWATNCPEYKVTAVQVIKVTQPALWQQRFREIAQRQRVLRADRVTQT